MDETKAQKYPLIAINTALIIFMYLIIAGLFTIIVLSLLMLVPPYYIRELYRFDFMIRLMEIGKVISSLIGGFIQTNFGGFDFAPLVIIIMSLFIIMIFVWLKQQLTKELYKLVFKKDLEELKSQLHLSDDSKLLTPFKEKLENLRISSKDEREELLKLFAQTKKKLESMGRNLAFLSIDVVDSTKMKVGEHTASIELDFKEYKRFVDAKLKAHGTLKAAWTPDGVMSCFPTVDAAVRTARDVIKGLEAFNANVKTMKNDFNVRCGINSGYVFYDETLPMEEMSDHVIDVAGHMQKYAAPNTIYIAKPSVEPLEEREGFMAASRVVDGYEVYEWKNK